MKIFLSWSGNSSKLVAEALRDWLPNVIQTIEPWLSSEDIPYGDRWQQVIATALEEAAAGIICLTRENIWAIWLTFEAGALAKASSLVCPYLLDVEPAEVKGPLTQFQCAKADRGDTRRLLLTLNQRSGSSSIPEHVLERAFELHWPSLEARLRTIRSQVPAPEVGLSLEEKVDEALQLLRILTQARAEPVAAQRPTKGMPAKPRVFIGSSTEGIEIAELVQLGLERVAECTLWTQSTFAPGQTTIESIVDVSLEYDFAVLILTADDMVAKRGIEAPAPRDNVLFELGLFTGALGRARTFMVLDRDKQIQLPSDLMGVTAITFAKRSDGNLEAALGPVCTRIKQAMGVAKMTTLRKALRDLGGDEEGIDD